MRAHVLQHVPFEGLGSILPWLEARRAAISYTRFFESPALPDPETIDFLIALGGPMSVNDERALPWLIEEKRFVARLVRSGKPVLGICLGAQLIASALGARVERAAHKEIGWLPIEGVSAGDDRFAFPPAMLAFHWHGETFALPEGAVRLARSEACANQAFQLGARTIALQFHLETTPESLEALVLHCADELVEGPYVQTASALRAQPARRFHAIHASMREVLAYLTRPT